MAQNYEYLITWSKKNVDFHNSGLKLSIKTDDVNRKLLDNANELNSNLLLC